MNRREFLLASAGGALLPFGGPRLNTKLGVYNGGGQTIAQIETWLGAQVPFTLYYPDYANGWTTFRTAGLVPAGSRAMRWSVALTCTGTPLSDVAAGLHNADFAALAVDLLSKSPQLGEVEIRLGWEMNVYVPATGVGLFPWVTMNPGGPAGSVFIAAWQQAVAAMRGVTGGGRFRFNWCPTVMQLNSGGTPQDPTGCYPGDAWVDIIAVDVYFNSSFDGTAQQSWNKWNGPPTDFSLPWAASYARTRGKPLAISEWGVNSNSYGLCVQLMSEWLRSNQVSNQVYWMSDQGGFTGNLSGNQYPAVNPAFIAAFNDGS